MSRAELDTIGVMAAVALACALPGVLLVLRRLVLVADAISHVLLLGIVLAYFAVGDASSLWLTIGAALSGVATVALVEALQRTKYVKEDAAIGLVFPALFSLGVVLASMKLKNVHLDVDRVLFGNAELAFLDTFNIGGITLPRAMVVLSVLFVLNAMLIALFFKELKLSIFDAGLAATLGFLPGVMHYALMASVSLTTVAAFDAVGPVLVLAFFAVPPVVARLLTDRLVPLFFLSLVFALFAAVVGTLLAFQLDTTIAGTVAMLLGVLFAVVFAVAPGTGLIAQWRRRLRQRRAFHETMLLVHLLTHEGTAAEPDEASAIELPRHFAWTATDVNALVARAEAGHWIRRDGNLWKLSPAGRARAQETLRRPSFEESKPTPLSQ